MLGVFFVKSDFNMKRCINCVLPETFPGIRFDEEGVCNFCRNFRGAKNLEEKKLRYKQRFEKLIKEHKGRAAYDAIMSYSGGKDSTYVLSILKERYGLSVFAVTFDNGFIPAQTLENIRNVAEKLCLDSIIFKPRFDVMKKIFTASSKKNLFSPKTLTRASTICTSCITIIKFCSLRLAVEKDIPFNVFGWSPGQIPLASSVMKNNPQIIKAMQKAVFEPLFHVAGDDVRPYFLEEKHFKAPYNFPYNISPLAFLDYDEERIFKKIAELGWKMPEGVDSNSTNCLLNSFANMVHKEQHGFHPYAFELAGLVREGYMDRSTALERLEEAENPATVRLAKKKLGL